jgi:hypothetical protein
MDKPSWASEVHEVTREEARALFLMGGDVYHASCRRILESSRRRWSWELEVSWDLIEQNEMVRLMELPEWIDFFYVRKPDR